MVMSANFAVAKMNAMPGQGWSVWPSSTRSSATFSTASQAAETNATTANGRPQRASLSMPRSAARAATTTQAEA